MLGFLIAAWCCIGFITTVGARYYFQKELTVRDILFASTVGCAGGLLMTLALVLLVLLETDILDKRIL